MGHYVLQAGDEAKKPTPEAAARDALTTLRGWQKTQQTG